MTQPPDSAGLRPDETPCGWEAESSAELLEGAWLSAAQAGSPEAFASLVQRYGPRILNYLHQMTGNRHDAEDLTQDTFVKAHRGLGTVRNPGAFAGWLFTIARRTALNHFRASRFTEELPAEIPLHGVDPASLMAERDDHDDLWRVARTLKREHFEVLWLHYAESLSIQQIAGVLRRTPLHVRVRLHRARLMLARRLGYQGQARTRTHPTAPPSPPRSS
jgi:RNA polymerase sigma-70 factor, ECF subfamily